MFFHQKTRSRLSLTYKSNLSREFLSFRISLLPQSFNCLVFHSVVYDTNNNSLGGFESISFGFVLFIPKTFFIFLFFPVRGVFFLLWINKNCSVNIVERYKIKFTLVKQFRTIFNSDCSQNKSKRLIDNVIKACEFFFIFSRKK